MTVPHFLALTWPWEPSVVLGCAVLLGGYLAAARNRTARETWCFVAGVVVLGLALDSPIDTLGDRYLFSAHMLQHLLLILVVPPLLLLGVPPAPAGSTRWQSRVPAAARRAAGTLGRPAVAWLAGVGTMWLWHAPALYNAALAYGIVHIAQHLMFLATSAIFWWPILAPGGAARLALLPAIVYLLAAALAAGVLGILLTFAPAGLYPAYLHPPDPLGLGPLLRDGWGLSPETDQQVGGLLMWIPGGLAYLCAMLGVLARWYAGAERMVEPMWRETHAG